jgi:hypothetical protein
MIMADKEYLDKETRKFLERYRAQFVDNSTRRRRTYMPTHLRDYCMDESAMDQYMQSHTEPLVTIEIPHSALDVVVENDVRYNELLREFISPSYKQGDISDTLRREHYLKRNNPGVRKAWDHYQLMLKLAWEGKDVG